MFASGLWFSMILAAIGMALASDCPLPQEFKNSYSAVNGNVTTYHCNGGFKFVGKTRNITCTGDLWETIKFSCIKTCGSPPEIPNASLTHATEDSAIYNCNLNFSASLALSTDFDIKLKCNENQWEMPNITCLMTSQNSSYNVQDISEKNVTFMPVINTSSSLTENGTLDKINTFDPEKESKNSSFYNLLNITEENATSLPAVNISTSFYENDTMDKMNNFDPESSESCPEAMDIPNSRQQKDSEGNITYICNPGYIQQGYNPRSFCENGTWTETDIHCFPEIGSESCPEAMDIPNSRQQKDSEGNITYICNPGYSQQGYNPRSFCENGTWTETDIHCVPENVIIKDQLFHKDIQRHDVEKHDSLICSFFNNEQNCSCMATVTLMKLILKQKIALHNYARIPTTSKWECVKFCLKNNSCLSFEFYETKNICYLSKTSSYFVDSYIVMKDNDVIYGEKTCQSTMPNKEVAYLPFNLKHLSTNTLLCNATQEAIFCGMVPSGRSSFINLNSYNSTDLCSVMQEVTFCDMLEEAETSYKDYNFDAIPPNSLFCSITQEKTTCGCSQREVSFGIMNNKKIAMHNMHSFHVEYSEKCIEECQHTQNCLSAEFKQDKQICQLSRTARYLVDKAIFLNSPNTLYFEKRCVFFQWELLNQIIEKLLKGNNQPDIFCEADILRS